MADVIERTVFENLLMELPGYHAGVSLTSDRCFIVSGYTGKDVIRDKQAYAIAGTIAEAVAGYRADFEKKSAETRKLRTAAECKAAVIDLIREHDAAPASFRDAVDALPVAE